MTMKFQADCIDISDLIKVNTNVSAKLSALAKQYSNTSGIPSQLNASLKAYMASVQAIGLPSGFNRSLLEVYTQSRQLDLVNGGGDSSSSSSFGDGYGSTFDGVVDQLNRLPSRQTIMSPYHSPLQLNTSFGTVLTLQTLYFETGSLKSQAQIDIGLHRPRAMECSLELAMQAISTNVTNNNFSETYVDLPIQADPVDLSTYSSRSLAANVSDPNTPLAERAATYMNIGVGRSDCLNTFTGSVDSINFTDSKHLSFQETRFSSLLNDWAVDPVGTISLAMSPASIFEGDIVSFGWANDTYVTVGPLQYSTGYSNQSSSSQAAGTVLTSYANFQRNGTDGDTSVLTLPDIMSNVANSLTYFLRLNSDTPVEGDAYIAQAVYRVNWAWISIPIVFGALALALTTAVALQTQHTHMPVRKDSAIAIMAHGVTGIGRELLLSQLSTDDLHRVAREIVVELGGRPTVLEQVATATEKAASK